MVNVLNIREQLSGCILSQHDAQFVLPYIEEGQTIMYDTHRGRNAHELCLSLARSGNAIHVNGSYYIGACWLKENEQAILVSPKLNANEEIDYIKMLNEALQDPANFEHLQDLIFIDWKKKSIPLTQQKDLLSIFLITEYIKVLKNIVSKGLRKSYYLVEENLQRKVKGRILICQNIKRNLMKGNMLDNTCCYQVYDVNSQENRILKRALKFCEKQLGIYENAIDISHLQTAIRYINPAFEKVDEEVDTRAIQNYKGNPIYRDYNRAIEIAQLLLKRFSYDITKTGKQQVDTPPFWIDMSKLFELYVFSKLRNIFTGKGEIQYHVDAHYQELDYLLNPQIWNNPYIIDAKYKPQYKNGGIILDDAREVSGYARLNSIYRKLHLDEDSNAPIKCLIIYPDQSSAENWAFTRTEEPNFEKFGGYIRMYKLGIKLPTIKGQERNAMYIE